MKQLVLGFMVFSFMMNFAEARRMDNRQNRQNARIQQGSESGQLTQQEQRKLGRGQARINRAEDRAESDGVVTRKEKWKVEKMQDHQSRQIYKEKHDNQVQPDVKTGAASEPTVDTAAPVTE